MPPLVQLAKLLSSLDSSSFQPGPRSRVSVPSPSLFSTSSRLLFIPSLEANYCTQTQVFLILHLTYLLTTRLPSLSPAADLTEPRPPRHKHKMGHWAQNQASAMVIPVLWPENYWKLVGWTEEKKLQHGAGNLKVLEWFWMKECAASQFTYYPS